MSIFSSFKVDTRLLELQERCAKLEREMHALQLDWENTYDKVRQMMGRIAKRSETLHADAEARGELFPGGAELTNAPRLTPHQLNVNQKILERRGLNKNNGG